MELIRVLPDTYVDSVALMRHSKDVSSESGVTEAVVVAGTPTNLAYLRRHGFDPDPNTGPNDLVIAVRADSDRAAAHAMDRVDDLLASVAEAARQDDGQTAGFRSISAASRERPASVALVAVPDRFTTYEVARALDAGLHVFCFSSGMKLEEEARLKRFAISRGLLLMGPDCGTAILDGVALGFANAVRRGPVGIVGASGTGIQEVSCLLDRAGLGISHAIGVGGRDLSSAVGGVMTRHALGVLGRDEGTEVIVVISKPADSHVASNVVDVARTTGKPAVLAFLGHADVVADDHDVLVTRSLEAAAREAARRCGAKLPQPMPDAPARPTPGWIRGVFSGGTLCAEAMAIVAEQTLEVHSNAPLRPEWTLTDPWHSVGHTFVDLGSDELTEGRSHPMIDPSLRNESVFREATDSEVGVVLFDVVLGYGSHPDPASDLAPVIERALALRKNEVALVAAVCGTEADPQRLSDQAERLQAAGAVVAKSSAQAARLALACAGISR
jgi:FdrA protein